MVVSPVVSLGGARPLMLGAAIAALTVCFLWLERLPLRPGLGVAALLGVALAGALPLAAVADRGEPWFDYKAFAEGLGPDDPVRFSWAQQVRADRLAARRQRGHARQVRRAALLEGRQPRPVRRHRLQRRRRRETAAATTPSPSCARTGATSRAGSTRSRCRSGACARATCPAPGTIMEVDDGTRPLRPSGEPGRWTVRPSCGAATPTRPRSYVPAPTPGELRQADRTGFRASRTDELAITVPFLPGPRADDPHGGRRGSGRVDSAVVHFRPFGDDGKPLRRPIRRSAARATTRSSGRCAARRTRRTWELAKRMRAAAETPFEYILLVNNYLQQRVRLLRAARSAAGRPRAARRVPVRHQGGLLPALLGRDGAAAAHGRRAGAGGDRLQPRRLLEAARRLDRARHRRARVGRGVVRRARLGHLRPDARTRPRRARRSPRWRRRRRPRRRRAGRGRPGGRRRSARRPAARRRAPRPAARPAAQQPGRRRRDRGGRRDRAGGRGCSPPLPSSLAAVALVRRHRRRRSARCRRSTARSPSSRPRCGAPAARCATGTTLRQLEQRLGETPDATAYLRALSASPLRPGAAAAHGGATPGAAPRARRRASARPAACARCGRCHHGPLTNEGSDPVLGVP